MLFRSMAVMSSADSALNSATAIFVKDLFEHQLGWRDTGDGRLLKLARICSAGLGAAAIIVAVIYSNIIGLLLFTYHVWAPAVILPICVGALSSHHSRRQNRIIVCTMLIATFGTLLYRAPVMLKTRLNIAVFNDTVYGVLEQFDPAVFGVLLSCFVFVSMMLGARLIWGPANNAVK